MSNRRPIPYIVTTRQHKRKRFIVKDHDTIYGTYRWLWTARRRRDVLRRYSGE